MSNSPSAKQPRHSYLSRKSSFLRNRESPGDVLPVYSGTAGGRRPGADLNRTFDNLEEDAERCSKRKPLFSFLSGRSKDFPSLNDELFREAKTAQSEPNWPSAFDVPEDDAPRDHAALRAATSSGTPHLGDAEEGRTFYRGGKQRFHVMRRNRPPTRITKHVQGMTLKLQPVTFMTWKKNLDIDKRRKFMLTLAKCLLTFGSPSHRTDTQLNRASKVLDAKAAFVHIPDVIIVTFGDEDVASVETHFVKAKGQIALTPLHEVHSVYRRVLHDEMTVEDGTQELKEILNARTTYTLWPRCLFAFLTAAMISAMVFGGSIIDMWISGLCAGVLQYLGLNAASKSATYANVYEWVTTLDQCRVFPADRPTGYPLQFLFPSSHEH